jgi:hypothetical protein
MSALVHHLDILAAFRKGEISSNRNWNTIAFQSRTLHRTHYTLTAGESMIFLLDGTT